MARERHTTYLKKAQEFLRAAESSMRAGDWDAVGLNSAHSAISAADALLVYYGGVRSTGESHNDVSGLIRQHVKDDQLGSKLLTLSKVLGYKNLAAYEDREVTEPEARDAANWPSGSWIGRSRAWLENRSLPVRKTLEIPGFPP
ncbi:MAG: HEPN domain-containing protein [Elusimicrobia bacterium]|nr:HEPN domain-containing protein [Elusimicrobiota bacterium]